MTKVYCEDCCYLDPTYTYVGGYYSSKKFSGWKCICPAAKSVVDTPLRQETKRADYKKLNHNNYCPHFLGKPEPTPYIPKKKWWQKLFS